MRQRLALATMVVLAIAPSAVASTPLPVITSKKVLALARLQGFYAVSGVVTKAVNVPGEHKGQRVTRIWAFVPRCPGACSRIKLVRQRANGKDTVILRRRQPAFYSGTGTFNAPVRCGGKVYRAGERARFTITVRITGAVIHGQQVLATRFVATYKNPKRVALTRCVTVPSSDAARYVGTPPAVQVTFRLAKSLSSTGS